MGATARQRGRCLLIASLTLSLSQAAPGAELRFLAGAPAEAWVEVTPLRPGPEASVLAVEEKATRRELAVEAAGLALVCAGGWEVGVRCEQVWLEPGSGLEMALGPGVPVAGRVLVGNRPARGARVSLLPVHLRSRRRLSLPLGRRGTEIVREVATDEAGRFSLPPLSPGEYRLEVRTAGGRLHHGEPFAVPALAALKGKAPEGKTAAPPRLDLGEIVLPQGLSAEVVVTSAAGLPLEGVEVGAVQGTRPEEARFFEARPKTAGIGVKAVLSGFEPAGPVAVTCRAEEHLEAVLRFEAPPPLVECVLEPAARLAGTVVDSGDAPVPGVTVSLTPGKLTATTDGRGRFSFGGLAAGAWRLVAAAPGFAPGRVEVELASGRAVDLDPIVLAPGRALRGVVRDAATGEPVAGARLMVTDPTGGGAATSDAEGLFSLESGDREPLGLRVAAAGYAPTRVEVPPDAFDAEEPFPVEISRGGTIRVEAWDETADAPCQGCAVSVQGGPTPAGTLTTDGQGAAVTEPLAPGDYFVGLVRQQSSGRVVTVQGGGDQRRVRVATGAVAVVQLGDRRRELVVTLRPAPPAGWSLHAKSAGDAQTLEPRSDGTFLLRRRSGESYVVFLGDGGGSQIRLGAIPAAADAPRLDLELPDGGLSGVLRRNEAPATGERLQLVSAAGGEVVGATSTDERGAFDLPFLPPGTYLLTASGQPLRSVAVSRGRREDLGEVEIPTGSR